MKKQKKQFTELSDDDLKKVTGGSYIQFIDHNLNDGALAGSNNVPKQPAEPCPANQISFTDIYGEQICITE